MPNCESAFGRFLPVASLLPTGQVGCTRWSVPMQLTGQMGAIAQVWTSSPNFLEKRFFLWTSDIRD